MSFARLHSFGVARCRLHSLYEELRMALIIVYQRLEVVHQRIINDRAVDGNRKLLQSVLLHGLQILHGAQFEVQIVGIAIACHAFCRAVDGTSFHHDASPCTPILAKERQLARALEILNGNEAAWLARFGEL